jgi:MEDS: MEthanogen/methylotroph, DcmR Sensory domain
VTGGRNGAAFVHQASVYGSQDEFLAMAVPFVEDGLSRGEPVLATTTSANLALLGENLGEGWQRVDQAESAYFGRRTSQRVAAFDRYWRRQAPAGGHVRILAEPIWSGRSDHEVAAWARMESTLNVVLSATNIWMICPYDTRVASPEVVAGARRTHPTRMRGITAEPCPEFIDPAIFTRACDADSLPDPPASAALLDGGRDLAGLRRFMAVQAATLGLTGERAHLLVTAANEAATCLLAKGSGRITARAWAEAGSIVCDLRQPAGRLADPFLGFRPPTSEPSGDDGLWLARQLCDAVDLRTDEDGCTVRLQVPGPRAEDARQAARA